MGLANTGLAAAIMTGWAGATVFWFGVAGVIWRLFFNPRIKALETQVADEKVARADDRKRCDEEIGRLSDRIKDLETILNIKPPRRKATTVGAKPRAR